jgi:hypothetical protein
VRLTETYSLLHEEFVLRARLEGVSPFAIRVLLAVTEWSDLYGKPIRSDQLELVLLGDNDGSMARRGLLELYRCGLVIGTASDGGRRRPGLRSIVTPTPAGAALVREIKFVMDAQDEERGVGA